MTQPLVSIVMPNKDCREYLPRAFDSIRAQQVDDIEIIVVDDGSTDGSLEWLEQRAGEDPRLRIIQLDGSGPSVARNRAVAQARAKLVAFLDADDQWLPDKLNAQLNFHARYPDALFSFTNYRLVDMDGKPQGECFTYWPWFTEIVEATSGGFSFFAAPLPHLYAENFVGTSTVVARTIAVQAAGGFSEDLQSASDWHLWLELASRGPAGFTKRAFCNYLVMRPGSMTSKLGKRIDAVEEIIERFHDRVAAVSPEAVRRAKAGLLVGKAELDRIEGRRISALGRHLHALWLAPELRVARATLSDMAALVGYDRQRRR